MRIFYFILASLVFLTHSYSNANDLSYSISCPINVPTERSGPTLIGKKLRHDYENGQSYIVKYDAMTITWEGVNGTEVGKKETDPHQIEKVSSGIYFVTWVEADRSFVSIVVNLNQMTVYSSGSSNGEKWQTKGKLTLISQD